MGERRSVDVFAAIANPRRRAILQLLAGSPMSLQEIGRELPISRQATSGHLRFLSAAGLVARDVAGARARYRLIRAGVRVAREYLDLVFGSECRQVLLGSRPRDRQPKDSDKAMRG